jgi:hypothetical protein
LGLGSLVVGLARWMKLLDIDLFELDEIIEIVGDTTAIRGVKIGSN